LHTNMGAFDGAIENVGSNVFAGIKLYPPMGFDPWPDGIDEKMKNVEALYNLCEEKKIPITAHCSDGGFAVADNATDYTNPEKWRQVLVRHPGLKLNLAHFGKQGNVMGFIHRHEWRETVVDLILSHDDVYTDISCLAFDEDFYDDFSEFLGQFELEKRVKLTERILFGSDFMINLLWANSYNEYLDVFVKTDWINATEKFHFCNENPLRFLFG
jgi:predicted TIM-barrel fold metal-dependent hydrolase